MAVTIKNIKVILTAPRDINLVVVKVETSEPGLYGIGCATFTQRYRAVESAINEHLAPILIGRDVDNIEDIWQSSIGSSYWRNGPVLNNAISGVDEALWDIKGKRAGMPVYSLLGGKYREAVPVYRHASGQTLDEITKNVKAFMDEGYRYIRCQAGFYGGGDIQNHMHTPENAPEGAYFDPKRYMEDTIEMFAHLRNELGYEIELCHDVHERLAPIDAVRFAKDLEPYRLFFLEDALAPEQPEWFERIRSQSAIPLAMGELFNNPLEWRELVSKHYIDFIRCHISQLGGVTPAKKLATFCEAYGVRTAWHGPGDLAPVGMVANLHLDLTSPNFGIQEYTDFSDEERTVFPGCPVARNGFVYVNDKPGWGMDIDEKAAAEFPPVKMNEGWMLSRLPDGTAVRP